MKRIIGGDFNGDNKVTSPPSASEHAAHLHRNGHWHPQQGRCHAPRAVSSSWLSARGPTAIRGGRSRCGCGGAGWAGEAWTGWIRC